jgi:hypothetical protein
MIGVGTCAEPSIMVIRREASSVRRTGNTRNRKTAKTPRLPTPLVRHSTPEGVHRQKSRMGRSKGDL